MRRRIAAPQPGDIGGIENVRVGDQKEGGQADQCAGDRTQMLDCQQQFRY